MADSPSNDERIRKERSPSFPFIPLAKAVERARAVANAHRRNPARIQVVGETWGYAPKSSGLIQTVAAMKAFGLMEDTGRGEDRRILLTDLAWRILHDTREGAREEALRDAAVRPRLIAEYLPYWLPIPPSDHVRLSELTLDRGFTPDAAKLFMRVFDETTAFANLSNSDSLSRIPQDREIASDEPDGSYMVPAGASGPTGPTGSTGFTGYTGYTGPTGGPTAVSVRGETPRRFYGGGPAMPMHSTPRATLPLPEGMAALEIPYAMSRQSYDALKAWIEVMVSLAEKAIVAPQPAPPLHRPPTPSLLGSVAVDDSDDEGN